MYKNALWCYKSVICYIIFLQCLLVSSAKANDIVDYKILRTIKSSIERQEKALEIQRHLQLMKDTSVIFRDLKEMQKIAIEKDDKGLACLYYTFMANQYSVISDGTNNRSDAYHQKAIAQAKAGQLPAMIAVTLIHYGYYYYNYRQMVPAYKYFLEADLLLKDLDLTSMPMPGYQLKLLGYYNYYIKDYNQAIYHLKLGLKYPSKNKREVIDITNTIGLCYAAQHLHKQAMGYYNNATNLAKANKDSVWVGIVAGNIGRLEVQNKQYDLALDHFKLNRAYSIRFNEPLDAMDAMIDMADIYSLKKEWNLADQYLNEAETYLAPKPFFLKSKLKIAQIRASVAEGTGNGAEQAKFLNQFIALQDSMQRRDNEGRIERVKLLWEKNLFDKKQEQTLLRAKEDNDRNRNFIILIFLILLILILIIRSQLLKNKHATADFEKHELAHQVKQQEVERELYKAKLDLLHFTENLRLKNKQLEQLRREHAQLEKQNDASDEHSQNILEDLLRANLMTEDSWKRFRQSFVLVYPDFFNGISAINPTINESEIRMLSLIKLELNNREISNMLGITLEGVKKAKQRLRKKMGNWPDINNDEVNYNDAII